MEVEFNAQKVALDKENLDLKIQINSIQDVVNQKMGSINAIEKEKKKMEAQIAALKNENKILSMSLSRQLDAINRKNTILKKRIATLENLSLVQRIKQAIGKEDNDSVKIVLEDMLKKVELAREGKSNTPQMPDAEPQAVVDSVERNSPQMSMGENAETVKEKKGAVLSLDRKNNLIVVNFGRKDGVREGDRYKICRDEKEIAQAEVMGVRYRISAAFIDDIKYKYNINDIKEGDIVVMMER